MFASLLRLKDIEAREQAESERIQLEQIEHEAARRAELWKAEEQQKRMLEEEEQEKQAAAIKQDAELAHLKRLIGINETPKATFSVLHHRSIRSRFKSDEFKVPAQLSAECQNFLFAGQLLLKHTLHSTPRHRHVYMTLDCAQLIWKKPQGEIEPKHRMAIFKIQGVQRGRCTEALKRKYLNGKFIASDSCCFAMFGVDESGSNKERDVSLEAKNEAGRELWMKYLTELIAYARNKRLYGDRTVQMLQGKNQLLEDTQ